MSNNIYGRPAALDGIGRAAHAIIEASAGTGKTHAIEHLIVHLLLASPCTIEQILVLTFTEKATAELRGRVRMLLEAALDANIGADAHVGAPAPLEEAHQAKLRAALSIFDRAPIFTIHAFCQRTLAEFAFYGALRFDLEVIDGRLAFHRAFRAGLRELAADPAIRERLAQWLARDSIGNLEKLLFEAHRRRYLEIGGGPASAAAQSDEACSDPSPCPAGLEGWLLDRCLPPVAARLDAFKRARGLLDYDDMLAWMWRALEGAGGSAMRSALRERFRYALVDEFQDTDDLQWRILRRIFVESPGPNRLYVVGDPKQAIYGFRGADVNAYLGARDELRAAGAACLPLVTNFRSTGELIEALNLILDQSAAAPLFTGEIRYDRPVRCGRPDRKALDAAGRPVAPVTLMRYEPAKRGGAAPAAEARAAIGRHIAATLRRLLFDDGCKVRIEQRDEAPRAVAAGGVYVLTRSHEESEEIGRRLREAGVPFAFYKLDGLFQTPEARHLLDVLRAVEQPHVRSRRLKAWVSPFFGVPLRGLAALDGLSPAHPLIERLEEWRALAERERFAELFDRLFYESGLAERELLLSNGERELTNYRHILELLLEQASARRLSLSEIIALLEDYVAKRAHPPGVEGNLQRLENERPAVQVMTVHMAKGLQADVVALYGGMHRSWKRGSLAVYHAGRRRRFAIGKEAVAAVKERLRREEEEEDQRLLYVALTRARAKLYLPLFPEGSIRKGLDGYYGALNDRLNEIIAGAVENKRGPGGRESELFAVESVRDADESAGAPDPPPWRISEWRPSEKLLGAGSPPEPPLASLRRTRAPLVTASYTSLKRFAMPEERELAPEDFKDDLEAPEAAGDLAGGSEVGLFLHEAIERLDLASFGPAPDLAEWMRRDDVRSLFRSVMRRRGVGDPRWFERGCEAVFNALTAPLALEGGRLLGPLYACRSLREMEFVYPIPQPDHPALARPRQGAWTAGRGYLKGFVDFVFEQEGRVYFADWKSDLLPSYGADSIKEHVRRHYELQARIYSVGVVRLLRVASEAEYERRFGGLLYVFLRGVPARAAARNRAADGVHFYRPRWPEICRYESELMELAGL